MTRFRAGLMPNVARFCEKGGKRRMLLKDGSKISAQPKSCVQVRVQNGFLFLGVGVCMHAFAYFNRTHFLQVYSCILPHLFCSNENPVYEHVRHMYTHVCIHTLARMCKMYLCVYIMHEHTHPQSLIDGCLKHLASYPSIKVHTCLDIHAHTHTHYINMYLCVCVCVCCLCPYNTYMHTYILTHTIDGWATCNRRLHMFPWTCQDFPAFRQWFVSCVELCSNHVLWKGGKDSGQSVCIWGCMSSMYICIHTQTYKFTCTHSCRIALYIYIYIYIHTHICMYVCIYNTHTILFVQDRIACVNKYKTYKDTYSHSYRTAYYVMGGCVSVPMVKQLKQFWRSGKQLVGASIGI